MVVAVYISPGKSATEIRKFLHENLLIYTKEGSALLGENYHQIPMILSGDFNINFAEDTSQSLIDFLHEKFDLSMSNDKNTSTTRYGTTIDAVFSRFLEKMESRIFICYFSYHKPIVSFIEFDNDIHNTESIQGTSNIDSGMVINDVE